jgi:hypothetical protein
MNAPLSLYAMTSLSFISYSQDKITFFFGDKALIKAFLPEGADHI